MNTAGRQGPVRGRRIRTLIAVGLAGLVIGAVQPYGVEELLQLGHRLAATPAYLLLVVLAMVLLLTFGLPGSLGVWLIAPFQSPVIATALLVLASVGGALGAYQFSARFRGGLPAEGFSARVLALLSRHGGWATQTALRILPGFPHSMVNFAGGILGLPLVQFLLAATLGLTVKWAVYATAIHQLVDVVEEERALDWRVGLPLLALTVLILAGAYARRRLRSR
jgi:uncharacterized membrane protein YdjX (TVP38/TMEM64 family)